MPRPGPKPRHRKQRGLTEERLHWLILGFSFFHDKPFQDWEEARECWLEFREEILARRSNEPGMGVYLVGCRPWGWWVEHGEVRTPQHQGGLLDEIGELGAEEKEQALEYARAHFRQMRPVLTSEPNPMPPAEVLLWYHPELPPRDWKDEWEPEEETEVTGRV